MFRCGLLLTLILLVCGQGSGQGIPPIGYWRDQVSFHQAIAVQSAQGLIHCVSPGGYFRYDPSDNSFHRKTKVDGLSGADIGGMALSPNGSAVCIWYADSRMDILEGDRIHAIPDLAITTVPGDKRIFRAYWLGDRIYLSTGLGIVVLDAQKYLVRDTWRPSASGSDIRVNAFYSDGSFYFAATEEGLKRMRIAAGDPANYQLWQTVSSPAFAPGPVDDLDAVAGKLYMRKKDSVYIRNGTQWQRIFIGTGPATEMDSAGDKLLICEQPASGGKVWILDSMGSIEPVSSSATFAQPRQAIQEGGDYWVADKGKGLMRLHSGFAEIISPDAPGETVLGDLVADGPVLWASAGAVGPSWQKSDIPAGIFKFDGNQWANYNGTGYPILDSCRDVVALALDSRTGKLYAGSFGGGLISIAPDGGMQLFRQGSGLQPALGSAGDFRVAGLAADPDGGLWISNDGAPQELVLKKADDSWLRFSLPFAPAGHAAGQLLIDGFGRKWIQSPKANGLYCFDDGLTPDQISDDRWRYFRSGPGQGNLPSSEVLCMAEDRIGNIWVGTSRGVAVIACGDQLFSTAACEALWPVLNQDGLNGYLFRNEEVKAIAVDGANRKWVGTLNGLWLVSADGQKILQRFTAENSPLPDNRVRRIRILPGTGEVFVATERGLVSYRAEATEPRKQKDSLRVFPNPVPPGYTGAIAIRGLPENAWVKIAELDGRLVWQGRSAGGQAVWNGKNYLGRQPASGAYLVLITDESNRDRLAARIFFMR